VDYNQAFKWWSRAAEAGSTDAQWGLGLLYDEGKGVPRDSKKAANWWKRGAEHGNIKATVNLAFLYEEGRGVELNQKESARLFKQAAEAGEPFAQVKYGLNCCPVKASKRTRRSLAPGSPSPQIHHGVKAQNKKRDFGIRETKSWPVCRQTNVVKPRNFERKSKRVSRPIDFSHAGCSSCLPKL